MSMAGLQELKLILVSSKGRRVDLCISGAKQGEGWMHFADSETLFVLYQWFLQLQQKAVSAVVLGDQSRGSGVRGPDLVVLGRSFAEVVKGSSIGAVDSVGLLGRGG